MSPGESCCGCPVAPVPGISRVTCCPETVPDRVAGTWHCDSVWLKLPCTASVPLRATCTPYADPPPLPLGDGDAGGVSTGVGDGVGAAEAVALVCGVGVGLDEPHATSPSARNAAGTPGTARFRRKVRAAAERRRSGSGRDRTRADR